MGELIKNNEFVLDDMERKPDRIETYAGKYTARVTQTFINDDGTKLKKTRKINKDGSITDKLERKHN